MKKLLAALSRGTNTSAVLIAAATFLILWGLGIENWIGISFSVVCGLLAGVIIGKSTEYYTSQSYRPTQKVAESSETGPATVIISGLGLGMTSTAIPVVTVGVAIVMAFLCAINFDIHNILTPANLSLGLYKGDKSHLSCVTSTGTCLDYAAITAVNFLIFGGNLIKELLNNVFLCDVCKNLAL